MLSQYSFLFQILTIFPLLALLRFISLLPRASARRRTTIQHEAAFVLWLLYLLALSAVTVNYYQLLRGDFSLATEYNLIPMAGIADILAGGNRAYALRNILGNVVLFLPMGFLPPLLWRRWNFPRALLLGLLCSAGIETLQFFTGRGTDIDDVLLNTLGSLAGFAAYSVFRLALPRFAEKCKLRKAKHGRAEKKPARPAPAAAYLLISLLCIAGGAILAVSQIEQPEASAHEVMSEPVAEIALTPQPTLRADSFSISSANAILIEPGSGDVLLEKGADARIYPASMTKIMTALLAIEQIPDMDALVLLRDEIYEDIYASNASTAGFLPGESVRALDLLYGLFLPSGAECALGLAEHVAGSERDFVRLMNERADALGLENTHFTNATGLHDEEHYSTVRDTARLLEYALENSQFHALITTARHSTKATNLHPDGITFYSTLASRAETLALPGGEILGGKTGYTGEAGQCLASVANLNGRVYILVTAGARPEDFRAENLHIEDAFAIYSAI